MAPSAESEATVVVWTPGPANSAYFEHAFLARQMGVELPGPDEHSEPVWIGADPTNRCLAGVTHVKIGHGRFYADVAPVKGLYLGSYLRPERGDGDLPAGSAGEREGLSAEEKT